MAGRSFHPEIGLKQTWTTARLIDRAEFALLLATVTALLFVAGIWVRNALAEDTPPVMATITVGHGDTLWNLAEKYGDPEQYILERVNAFSKVNHIAKGRPLQEGETLVIPVGNKSARLYYGGKYANREIAD